MDPLVRPDTTKRSGGDHSDDEYQTVQEPQQQRIEFNGSIAEAMEDETVKIKTLEGKLQMRICKETVDLSYIGSALLEEVIEQTDVGAVLSQLDAVSMSSRAPCGQRRQVRESWGGTRIDIRSWE